MTRIVECIQFPQSVRPTPESLVWTVTATQHEIRRGLLGRRVATEHTTTEIDFATFGITNPILARGCMGLLELGVLRDPNDLIALLEEYKQHGSKNQEEPNLNNILNAAFPDDNPAVTRYVMRDLAMSVGHLSQVYSYFMPIELSLSYDGLVNHTMELDHQEHALSFLDTFIKTYVGLRRATVGHAQSYHLQGSDDKRQGIVTKLHKYVDKKLYMLAEAYRIAFGKDDNEYLSKNNPAELEKILRTELQSGDRFLGQMRRCPPEYRMAQKSSYPNHEVDDLTSITDMRTGKSLSGFEHSVDEVVPLQLRSGKVINFYNMRACPFIAHGNHPVA